MKKHIKLILRTLFSNNACVEAARTKELKYNIIAVVFVVLALFLAALPTCVTGFQQKGGNVLRGTTYDFETGMRFCREELDKDHITLTLDKHKVDVDSSHWYDWKEGEVEHKSLLPTYPSWDADGKHDHPDLHYYLYEKANPSPDEETMHKVLEVYVCPSTKKFSKFVADLANNLDPFIDRNKKDDNYSDKWLEATDKVTKKETTKVLKARSTSFLVIGQKQVQLVLYAPGVTSPVSSVVGDYQNTRIKDADKDLIHYLVNMDDYNQTLKNCRKFFDQCYINIRNTNTWRSTGIILGVDAGVILLMGVMVFILTRGKNNPFRIYSFWDGQKIAYYACLTPGMLALFGFLMSNMAMMLFILAAGVRVMWLSMRTLRYQAPNKQ